MAVGLPEGVGAATDKLFQQVLAIMHEEGDLAKDINDALANDGLIDAEEHERIQKDLQQCIVSLVILQDAVRMRFEADCK